MKREVSKALMSLSADYASASTQSGRDAAIRKIANTSYREERDRERKLRNAKCRAHLADSVHLADFDEAESRDESPGWISDGGKGEEAVMTSVAKSFYTLCIKHSRELLKKQQPLLVIVFNLIVENVNNRLESIGRLEESGKRRHDAARELYFDHRKKLLKFFLAQ